MVNIKRLYSMDAAASNSVKSELKGTLSVQLKSGKTLDEFCKNNFENYDSERFEAVALRVYYGKETIITLFARDRNWQQNHSNSSVSFPVKKFKKGSIDLLDLMLFIEEFNFTLNAGHFPIEDMEVINK
jgi:hypothetical protein